MDYAPGTRLCTHLLRLRLLLSTSYVCDFLLSTIYGRDHRNGVRIGRAGRIP